MHTIKIPVLFVIIIFGITGCEKDNQNPSTIIKGKLVDYYTQETIPHTLILIKSFTIDPHNPQVEQLNPFKMVHITDTFRTDHAGEFYRNTTAYAKGSYAMFVYTDSSVSSHVVQFYAGDSVFTDLKIKYLSVFNLHISDSSNNYDRIFLELSSDIDEYPFNSLVFSRNGLDLDTTYIFKVAPDAYIHFNFVLFKDENKERQDTFNILIPNEPILYYDYLY